MGLEWLYLGYGYAYRQELFCPLVEINAVDARMIIDVDVVQYVGGHIFDR